MYQSKGKILVSSLNKIKVSKNYKVKGIENNIKWIWPSFGVKIVLIY